MEENTGSIKEQGKENSNSQEDAFVPKNAYEAVSKDMHKYKSQNKELAARLNELESKLRSAEETKMAEEKRFEELYERERKAREEAEAGLKQTHQHYIKTVKMTALMKELGDIKPKYLAHADLDSIIVHEDGSLSSESVLEVANKFRQENPELVPNATYGTQTDLAPSSEFTKNQKSPDLENLSPNELRDLLSKAPRGGKKGFN